MPLTRTAIRQALHHSFGLTFAQIARLDTATYGNVRDSALGIGCKAWASRPASERTEAIAAARALIEGRGSLTEEGGR